MYQKVQAEHERSRLMFFSFFFFYPPNGKQITVWDITCLKQIMDNSCSCHVEMDSGGDNAIS